MLVTSGTDIELFILMAGGVVVEYSTETQEAGSETDWVNFLHVLQMFFPGLGAMVT